MRIASHSVETNSVLFPPAQSKLYLSMRFEVNDDENTIFDVLFIFSVPNKLSSICFAAVIQQAKIE